MKLTQEQRKKIMNRFPQQRGNVKVDTSRFLDAIIYICENGCTWRTLPEAFGPWHTIYLRINRQVKNGVLEQTFHALREEQITNRRITVVSLDSSSVKVHPDGTGALKKRGTGSGRLGHEDTPDGSRQPMCCRVYSVWGEASDAGNGRLLLDAVGRMKEPDEEGPLFLLKDRAYEGRETRRLAFEWGYSPVVPPKKDRKNPWKYDKELYTQRKKKIVASWFKVVT
jgi:transposase